MKKLYILKLGGNIIDDPIRLDHFLEDFAKLPGPKILVHGGGKVATDLSQILGIDPKMINGRRVTDAETLKVVTMVYGGLINKNIVAKLQSSGCDAIGLSGADAGIIPARKRNILPYDYGFVGDITPDEINSDRITSLLDLGLTPVIAPLTHDRRGSLLNTNADTIASSLAVALSERYETHLLYCFEKAGVLENVQAEDSIIPSLSAEHYMSLKEQGKIAGGMLPKLDTAFGAIEKGVSFVWIGHAEQVYSFIRDHENSGTRLYS